MKLPKFKKLRKAWRWCFVRRLAINPMIPTKGNYYVPRDKMLFEWQTMPKGFRWF